MLLLEAKQISIHNSQKRLHHRHWKVVSIAIIFRQQVAVTLRIRLFSYNIMHHMRKVSLLQSLSIYQKIHLSLTLQKFLNKSVTVNNNPYSMHYFVLFGLRLSHKFRPLVISIISFDHRSMYAVQKAKWRQLIKDTSMNLPVQQVAMTL